jgi:hypothetical protein
MFSNSDSHFILFRMSSLPLPFTTTFSAFLCPRRPLISKAMSSFVKILVAHTDSSARIVAYHRVELEVVRACVERG